MGSRRFELKSAPSCFNLTSNLKTTERDRDASRRLFYYRQDWRIRWSTNRSHSGTRLGMPEAIPDGVEKFSIKMPKVLKAVVKGKYQRNKNTLCQRKNANLPHRPRGSFAEVKSSIRQPGSHCLKAQRNVQPPDTRKYNVTNIPEFGVTFLAGVASEVSKPNSGIFATSPKTKHPHVASVPALVPRLDLASSPSSNRKASGLTTHRQHGRYEYDRQCDTRTAS